MSISRIDISQIGLYYNNKVESQDAEKRVKDIISQGKADKKSLYKGIKKYRKRHKTKIEHYCRKYNIAEPSNDNPLFFRTLFVKLLEDIINNENHIKYKGDQEMRASKPEEAMTRMEEFLGKKGLELYKLALKEERYSQEYIEAVLNKSTTERVGVKYSERLIRIIAGPSASGKSYVANESMKACEPFLEKSKVITEEDVSSNPYDVILYTLDPKENLEIEIKNIAEKYNNKPILVKQGNEIYCYGLKKNNEWGLDKISNQLNQSLINEIKFPEIKDNLEIVPSKAKLCITLKENGWHHHIVNYDIAVDGGIAREVSQMRKLVIKAANDKGFSGIKDLNTQSNILRNVKKKIQNYVLQKNNTHGVVIPNTFSRYLIAGMQNSLIDKIIKCPNSKLIFCCVTGKNGDTFKKVVSFMGSRRALKTNFTNKINYDMNDNKDDPESKVYQAKYFDSGREGSNNAASYFKEKVGKNYIYMEVINDLVLKKEDPEGSNKWRDPYPNEGGEIIMISERLFDKWEREKDEEGKNQNLLSYMNDKKNKLPAKIKLSSSIALSNTLSLINNRIFKLKGNKKENVDGLQSELLLLGEIQKKITEIDRMLENKSFDKLLNEKVTLLLKVIEGFLQAMPDINKSPISVTKNPILSDKTIAVLEETQKSLIKLQNQVAAIGLRHSSSSKILIQQKPSTKQIMSILQISLTSLSHKKVVKQPSNITPLSPGELIPPEKMPPLPPIPIPSEEMPPLPSTPISSEEMPTLPPTPSISIKNNH